MQTLTTPEIVLFTLIYTSEEACNALPKDYNFDEKLDFILSKHVEQMTAEEFGSVCNSIVGREGASFTTFVKESIPTVQQWLSHNELPLSQLPSVVGAVNIVIDDMDSEKKATLIDKIEGCIFENARKLATSEAVDLVCGVSSYASAETMEVLDRIIGNGIYEVKAEQVIPALEAFL